MSNLYWTGVATLVIWVVLYATKRRTLKGKTLLVVAHPDDECMFFSPSVLAAADCHILCLSKGTCLQTIGNRDGLGDIRARELRTSAEKLGVTKVHLSDEPYSIT